MSLYGDYIKETFGKDIVEDNEGFVSFSIVNDECYVEDVYVIPEARLKGKTDVLMAKVVSIAKEKGCKYLTTTINPGIKTVERSMIVILNYGFKFHSSEKNKIIFIKELDNVTSC